MSQLRAGHLGMELEIIRRIRGNVHGTIDVTALEDRVIAHPIVQRLRRIRQLAFLSFVFPGATHSRFEHSLGVMQLAGVTWSKLKANQKRLAMTCSHYRDFDANERRGVDGLVHGLLQPAFGVMDDVFGSPYTLQCLRLAGLLHDLGHPPFSHSGERFLPSWGHLQEFLDPQTAPYLQEFVESRVQQIRSEGREPADVQVRHEIYTLLLADTVLRDVDSQSDSSDRVEPRDVISILEPSIPPASGSPLAAHGTYRLCHELISGEVDIDRMDYLLRDSRECGVVYGIFDATRIQDSLNVYYDPLDGCLHLAISFSGLAAFEDYLRARHSMYLQLYFHKTAVAAEAMMQALARQLGGWRLPADLNEYADLDETNIGERMREAAQDALGSGQSRTEFERTLTDLMRHRRLWKRVYEVSSFFKEPEGATIDKARRLIADSGYRYEQVSSKNSLTTFRPRNENEMSSNYLRLIKKDEKQFPRVVPIEDHSTLIANGDTVHIKRIYVERGSDPADPDVPERIRQLLTDQLGGAL